MKLLSVTILTLLGGLSFLACEAGEDFQDKRIKFSKESEDVKPEEQLVVEDESVVRLTSPTLEIIALRSNANTLQWNEVPGAVSYDLFFAPAVNDTLEGATKIENVKSPYTHLKEPSVQYLYSVVANAANPSGSSLPASFIKDIPEGYLATCLAYEGEERRTMDLAIASAGKSDCYILSEEIVTVTSLNLSNQGIIELGPLKDFVNLETLDLSGNEITNLEAIESIISLKNINLSENSALTDLSSLAGLTAIEELRISATAVATIVDLANLSELTVFEAAGNQIIDVSPLATLQKLASIDLSQNPINRTEATCPAVSVPTALANFCLEGVTVAYNPHIQKLIGLHCIGCHPDYGTEAGIIAEAQLANTAIANGTMPMGADPLSATDMAIFNQWFLSLPPAAPAPAQ